MNKHIARQSNIELLRIFAMVLIVACHMTAVIINNPSHPAYSLVHLLGTFGNATFFMIAGYFVSESSLKLKRIIKVLYPVIAYVIIYTFIAVMLNLSCIFNNGSNPFQIIWYFFTGGLWFPIGYVFLMIIVKYTYNYFCKISQKTKYIIITLLIILSLIAQFTKIVIPSFFTTIPVALTYLFVIFIGITLKKFCENKNTILNISNKNIFGLLIMGGGGYGTTRNAI